MYCKRSKSDRSKATHARIVHGNDSTPMILHVLRVPILILTVTADARRLICSNAL
jgi:hypothetical protein